MNTVHSFFRREFRLAGGVVRAVTARDVRRAKVVRAHIDFICRSLHHHHTVEDELAWAKLLERVPEERAPIVHLMESQHQTVDALLTEIDEVSLSWSAAADPGGRDRLAELLDSLYIQLAAHLDAEEERLPPIAARNMTEAEWHEIGATSRKHCRRSELSLALGMFQYGGDPQVIAGMLAEGVRNAAEEAGGHAPGGDPAVVRRELPPQVVDRLRVTERDPDPGPDHREGHPQVVLDDLGLLGPGRQPRLEESADGHLRQLDAHTRRGECVVEPGQLSGLRLRLVEPPLCLAAQVEPQPEMSRT